MDAAESVFHKNVDLSWFAVPYSFCFSWMDDETKKTMRMNPERAFFYLKDKGIFDHFEQDVKKRMGYEPDWPTNPISKPSSSPLVTYADLLEKTKDNIPDVFNNLKKHCEKYKFDEELVRNVIKKMQAFVRSYESAVQAKSDLSAEQQKTERDSVFYYRLRYHFCYLFELEFVNNENYHLLLKDFPVNEDDKAAKEEEAKKKEERERKAERKAEKKEKEMAEGGGAKK